MTRMHIAVSIMIRRPLALLLLACSFTAAVPASANSTAPSRSWDFEVLLDGSPIGYHRFELVDDGEQRRLSSEAKFDVRFLFINAYRYRHNNTEVWSDGCLEQIESRTQANGKELSVFGERGDEAFVVDDGSGTSALRDCVMTFAYWNPEFLQQPRLLNPQCGEYLEVGVDRVGREPITVRGEEIDASVYRVTARGMELKLWYSPDDEWLALESVAKGGRIIRYELT